MGFLFRKKRELFESRPVVRLTPEAQRALVLGAEAGAEVSASLCPRCGKPMEVALLVNRLPSEPAQPEAPAFVADGWTCFACGTCAAPRFLSVEQSLEWGRQGTAATRAGAFGEGEWWFTRITGSWPGYPAAWLDLATALHAWSNAPNLQEQQAEALRGRRLESLRRAMRWIRHAPERSPPTLAAEALCRLAEAALEARAWADARGAEAGRGAGAHSRAGAAGRRDEGPPRHRARSLRRGQRRRLPTPAPHRPRRAPHRRAATRARSRGDRDAGGALREAPPVEPALVGREGSPGSG